MAQQIIKKFKTTLYYSFLALTISLPASLGSASAGTAPFTLTPNSGTYNVGDYLTVEIRENSGSVGVNFVQPKLVYDANVLSFQSIDTSQSPFTSPVGPVPAPNGVVDLTRGIVGTSLITGDKNVAFVTFKITGAASASSLSFANTSSIRSAVADPNSPTGVSTNEEWNGVATGATLVFKALPVTPPPSGGGSGGSGSTSSGGKSTAPAAKKVTVAGVTSTAPPTTTLAPVQPGDSPESDDTLVPSEHMVSIKVVDSKGKSIVGAEVKLGTQSTHTLSDGSASFIGISDGKYTVSVAYKGKTTKQEVTVNAKGQPSSSVQNFKVKLASSSAIPTWVIYTGIGLLIIFLLGFFIPRRRHGIGDFAPIQAVQPAVVGNMTKKSEVVRPAQTTAPAPEPIPTPPPPPLPPPSSAAKPVAPGSIFEPNVNNSNKDQQQ